MVASDRTPAKMCAVLLLLLLLLFLLYRSDIVQYPIGRRRLSLHSIEHAARTRLIKYMTLQYACRTNTVVAIINFYQSVRFPYRTRIHH